MDKIFIVDYFSACTKLETGAAWLAVKKVQKYKALAFKSIVRVHWLSSTNVCNSVK